MLCKALTTILFCQILLIQASFVPLSRIVAQSSDACERTAEFKPNSILIHRRGMSIDGGFLKRFFARSLNECYFACCAVASCTSAVFKSRSSKECLLFNCVNDSDCTYEPREMYDVLVLSRAASAVHHVGVGEPCGPTKICQTNHSVCSDGRCDCQSGYLLKDSVCVQSVCQSPQLQFQCADSSTCVAIYDKCNGIIECPDGSDEIGCSSPAALDTTMRRSYVRSHLLGNSNEINQTRERTSLPQRFVSVHKLVEPVRSPMRTHRTPLPIQDRSNIHNSWETDEDLHPRGLVDEVYVKPPNLDAASNIQHGMSFFREDAPQSLFNDRQTRAPDLNDDDDAWEQSDLWIPSSHKFGRIVHSSGSDKSLYRSKVPSIYIKNNRLLSHEPDETRLSRVRSPIRLSTSEIWDSHMGPYSVPDFDNDALHSWHPSPSDNSRIEGLIDPSVFRHFRPQRQESSKPTVALYGSTPSPVEPPSGSHQLLSNSPSPPSDTVIAVLGRSQTESHTSALLLAFGLGLVCCFIVLLIWEWRRRSRTSTWAMRRRPTNLPVLFNERRKPGAMQMRSSRRPKSSIRAMNNPTGSEEENETLCDGLVL